MKTLLLKIFSLLVLLFAVISCGDKSPQPGALPSSSVQSPVVNADNMVTIALDAPEASEVSLLFGENLVNHPMTKDDKGIWSVTVGPLEPELYMYAIIMDGVRIIDPRNPEMQGGTAPGYNLVNLPGNPPRFDEIQDVPHGVVEIRTYYSSVLKKYRKAYVYLPSSYNRDLSRKYPVLYLRHGGGGNETSWYNEGCAGIIMDNLLAQGKVKPMIIVMPNGNVENGAPGGYNDEAISIVSDELFTDIIPTIEENYRVFTDQQNRAVAGLSMGGGQSFYIGLQNIDQFDWVGVFSTGLFGGIQETSKFDVEAAIPGILTDTDTFNKSLKLFYISVGEQDPRLEATKQLIETFNQHNLNVVFKTYPGIHEWLVWRLSLLDFLPRLFK